MYIHNIIENIISFIRYVLLSDQEYLIEIGKAIVEKRKKSCLTQSELAFKVGLEVPNLSVIENGKSNPQLLTMVRIAAALGIELTELLPLTGNPHAFLESPAVYVPRKHPKKEPKKTKDD
jgi:transcriptional regulator with XRE-family HTH domain